MRVKRDEARDIYCELQKIKDKGQNQLTIKGVSFNVNSECIKDIRDLSLKKIEKIVNWAKSYIRPYADKRFNQKFNSDVLRYDYDSIVGEYITNHELIPILLLMDIKGESGRLNINVNFFINKKYKDAISENTKRKDF